MSLGVPGNAVVVNFLMRFPILIPVAAAVGISTVAINKEDTPPPAPPVVERVVEAPQPAPPVVVVPAPPPRVEPPQLVCPPSDKLTKKELAKLTPKERGQLKVRGCIKG